MIDIDEKFGIKQQSLTHKRPYEVKLYTNLYKASINIKTWVRRGRDRTQSLQSVPITTNVVSWRPTHGEVYLIQLYVIKFVSDLWQVDGFLRVLIATIYLKYC